jgi:hydroxymethylbilane synthase
LRAVRPDLRIGDLRGNVNTRLAKLDADDYDAIILACAGLERLGLQSRIRSKLIAPAWLPAAAQGAIAVEHRIGDSRVAELLKPLHDPATARCVDAERAMTRALQGNCEVPIAAFCIETDAGLHLDGLVGGAATGRLIRVEAEGREPETLGRIVADKLRAAGADTLLKPDG